MRRQDNIHFITGLARNAKLQKISSGWLDSAVASYRANGGKDVRMFHSFLYKAKSWKHQQRVVVKTEVNALGTNVRYVVTDFKGQRSNFIYSECYCDRGRMELMISELKNGPKADRMSCNKFTANQFRLFLHCAAYVLMHAFQEDVLTGTGLERCTIATMGDKLILNAVSIDEKKTCIRLEGPDDAGNDTGSDPPATSAAVIAATMSRNSTWIPREGKHCCAPMQENHAT